MARKVFSKEVLRLIREKPGISGYELSEIMKISQDRVGNVMYGLRARGVKFISKRCAGPNRSSTYTLCDQAETASPTIVKNINIKPKSMVPDGAVLATFSDSDRSQYFSFLEKAAFYTESAKLLITARKERIENERMAQIVKA